MLQRQMEAADPPECPVCLQSYEESVTIPRVIGCGHTICEVCLASLPHGHSHTVRCPVCVQLVAYPPQGPSCLPKNIDLLRQARHETLHKGQPKFVFRPRHCCGEFWKDWILPNDTVCVGDHGVLNDSSKMRLVRVCILRSGVNYADRVMTSLNEMDAEKRGDLVLLLKISSRLTRSCRTPGLWGCLKDGSVYLICDATKERSLNKLLMFPFEDALRLNNLFGFMHMAMELCEITVTLRLEKLVLGFSSISCIELDSFFHAKLCACEVLMTARAIRKQFAGIYLEDSRITIDMLKILVADFLRSEIFICPELLFRILEKEGIEVEGIGELSLPVSYSSDVWTLACILLRLGTGIQFIDYLVDSVDVLFFQSRGDISLDSSGIIQLLHKVRTFSGEEFGDRFAPFIKILSSCLNFDPGKRPHLLDVWRCVTELIGKGSFEGNLKLDSTLNEHVLIFGELCSIQPKRSRSGGVDTNNIEDHAVEKSFVEGLINNDIKFNYIHSHVDCVTGFAIGGGFLFSASFDKSIHMWSLPDLSLFHTFKGHEHRVMAIIFVDEGQPLCISGDSEGGIFIWGIGNNMNQEPLRKWYEPKDWRFSGIHALTSARNGHLYTGSGDRVVKAWSLQSYTLSYTLEGHKSVVSSLVSSDGVLYSGSWDGTVRLWSLNDHNILMVLGEEITGTMSPVLRVLLMRNILVAAHESGHIKIWENDTFVKSIQLHCSPIFTIAMEGRFLFSGGWDNDVNIHELHGDENLTDARFIQSIHGSSIVSTLLSYNGHLFIGYGDGTIKACST